MRLRDWLRAVDRDFVQPGEILRLLPGRRMPATFIRSLIMRAFCPAGKLRVTPDSFRKRCGRFCLCPFRSVLVGRSGSGPAG